MGKRIRSFVAVDDGLDAAYLAHRELTEDVPRNHEFIRGYFSSDCNNNYEMYVFHSNNPENDTLVFVQWGEVERKKIRPILTSGRDRLIKSKLEKIARIKLKEVPTERDD